MTSGFLIAIEIISSISCIFLVIITFVSFRKKMNEIEKISNQNSNLLRSIHVIKKTINGADKK